MSSAASDRPAGAETPAPVRGRRAAAEDLALFHRTLAEGLCRSEVPLPRAFRVLESDLARGPLRNAVRAMATEVESGTPLVEAYARHETTFPATYRALVRAGTESGDLAGVLDEIAAHASVQAEAEAQVRRTLAPTFLSAVVVLIVGSIALALVMPRLRDLVEPLGAASPAPYALGALGLVVLILAVLGVVAVRKGPAEGSLSFRLPVVGPIRRDGMRVTVLSTLALLLRRRLPLSNAVRLAAATAADPVARARLTDAADRAHEGASLGDVLRQAALLDAPVQWLVQSAGGSGESERALEDAARVYRRRLGRRLDRFALLVRPAADLALGVAVFGLAFAYMVPLIQGSLRLLWGG